MPVPRRPGLRATKGVVPLPKRAVGRGTRYEWKSLTDPEAKKVIADWGVGQEKKPEAPAES